MNNTKVNLISSVLSQKIDTKLSEQIMQEFVALEESFLLKRWKYTELDGGRFCEVSARIIYAIDSGITNLAKKVDDCLKYIENEQVKHNFPERPSAVHLSRVIRSTYKLRSQRGAVHVSPVYQADEMDSRLVIANCRWILAEILRLFWNSKKEEVSSLIEELVEFPIPIIRQYNNQLLVQHTGLTTEDEILVIGLFYKDSILKMENFIKSIPKDKSGIRRAIKKIAGPKYRQMIKVDDTWKITDLGIKRIENVLANKKII